MEEELEQVDWFILIDSAKKLAKLEITIREKEGATRDASK